MVLRQKIDVIASDVKGGAGKGKKELWQLSDESEASQPSAEDEEAGHDEDESEDGSVDSDGGGGALAARKPRPAKLIAVSSNDADRRQQRQVVCSLCLMSSGVCPGRVRSVTRLCRMICAMRILGACVSSCLRCTLWQMPKPQPLSPLLPVQLPKHRHQQQQHHHRHSLPNPRLCAQAHRNLDFHPGAAVQQQQGAAAAAADKRDDRDGGGLCSQVCAAWQAAAFALLTMRHVGVA